MRKKGDGKTDRPEQLLIAECLEHHLSPHVQVNTEEHITYVTESHQAKWADIDVFVVWQSPEDNQPGEYLIRVMGGYHDEPRQVKKDDLQRSYLMALHPPLRRVITVIDLWYHLMPITFKRNKRLLKKSELIEAYHEISKQTKGIFHLPAEPFPAWVEDSAHVQEK